ncbi:ComF family protein [Calothrix sp. NIES-3974]|uniref:ComF family protein n=1 Tax=Calothrix sp. NIES-3974 TaxID=2005462 RepID=UPI000B6154FB|nr:ComF family protein [Calothrix sp. NIES-3974]BAZ07191.1 hypothetical protein NIES3974_38540 [Calothrix sp. NIES-3974]
MKLLQRGWQGFLNLFLDRNCPSCGRATSTSLCVYCTRSLAACRLENPTIRSQANYPVLVWGGYRGTLKRAIATMKYHHHPEIGLLLGNWLGEIWWEYGDLFRKSGHPSSWGDYIVIPIPLHAHKQKQRGFNQAEIIGKGFCQITQMKLVPQGLVRVRDTKAQHLLGERDRLTNLTAAFQVGTVLTRYPSRPIILVDDIYTTGATVSAAMETLLQHRHPVVGVVAVATSTSESLTKN